MTDLLISVRDLPRRAMLVALGVGILFLSAQITIPIGPVPITLQTAAVAVIGLTYRKSLAMTVITTYLLAGALGAPIFAGFSFGITHMLGTSGGYLMGFLPATWAMTFMMEKINSHTWLTMSFVTMLGTAIIFAFGILWLSQFLGFRGALSAGLFPFMLPGFFKALVTAISVAYLKRPTKK